MMHQLKNIFLCSIVFVGLLNNLCAQQTAKRTDSDKGNMGYLEHLPSDYTINPTKIYPVLIFLHGLGERGNGTASDLQKVKRHGPPKHIENGHPMCFTINGQQECFIVISPQLPSNNSTWGPPKVHNVVDHILNGSDHYRVDPNRIYLTGLSLGGIGTYNYASNNINTNNTLAAIAPVAAKGTPSQACNISAREIPVWHFHGDQDNTVNYNQGLNMFNFIQNCTSPTPTAVSIFTTYPGVGHNAWSRAYRTDHSLHSPNLYEWFLSKSLNNIALPTAPSSLSGISNLNTSIDLTWIDNSSDETGFILERKTGNNNFQVIATIANNQTSYIDNNLTPNTTYEYRIKAVKNQTNSTYSNVINVITLTQAVAGTQTAQWATGINRGYLEYLPADYHTNPNQTYPVIIFLHGHGERGSGSTTDLNLVKRHGPPKHINNGHPMCFTNANGQQECFIVLSPQQTTNVNGWQGSHVIPFVQYALNNYRIDPDRVYLTGLSMGGQGTWNVAYSTQNSTNYFAALAPIAGRGDYNKACTVAQNNTPVWAFHGDQDNAMTIHAGRRPINGMIACGANPAPIFTVYTGVGHNSWSRAYRTNNTLHSPNIYEWFLQQSRNNPNIQTPPIAPSQLSSSNNSTNSIDLTWTDNSNNEISFELERQSSNSGFSLIATITNNSTAYTDINLTAGTTYEYRIRAINNQGNSNYSNILSVTTQNIPPVGNVQNVIWTDKVGVSEDSNGNLTSTAGYGWGNSGAASLQVIPANSDGWVEMTMFGGLIHKDKVFGLSSTNANANKDQIDYAFEIYGDNIAVYENGQRVRYLGKYTLGDVIRIERIGTDIQYLINGSLRKTTSGSTSSLLVDLAINHNNTEIVDAKIYIPSTPPPPSNSNSVIWTDKVGVSEDVNGNLTSTAGYGWGNSGAASLQVIPANSDGWVEMTLSGGLIHKDKVFGLSSTNANANKDQIDYAFEIYGDNIAAYENGQRVRYFGKYALGDVVRIERIGIDILYYINGVLRKTTTGSTSNLLVDVAINHTNTEIVDVKIHAGTSNSARMQSNNNSIYSFNKKEKQILIFPNPARQQITIQNIPSNAHSIEIYNILGTRVFQTEVRHDTTNLDISRLEDGWYSIHFVGSEQHQRFIKTK